MIKQREVLSELTKTFYPFAFYLMEDELQATQLIVDVTTAIILEDQVLLENLTSDRNQTDLFTKIYRLAKKRCQHMTTSRKKLDLVSKCSIYLYQVHNFSFESIAFIADCNLEKIAPSLIFARQFILENKDENIGLSDYATNL